MGPPLRLGPAEEQVWGDVGKQFCFSQSPWPQVVDLASKNIGPPVKCEFQIHSEIFFSISMSQVLHGTYTE